MEVFKPISSASEMIAAIRRIGLIPFTRCTVPGWSIEEITNPDFWFMSSDQLGPWDWKIDAVQDGIVYGKFIGRKSAFATEEMYRHLMNWRRSLPYYRMAIGEDMKTSTIDQRLQKMLSPVVLDAIREKETLESSEIRGILEKRVPTQVRKKVGGHMEKYLLPKVNRQAVDFIMQYLDMGTWTLVGDISRVYRGPNCEYKGWQRNSITTPDLLFKVMEKTANQPFWAKFIEDEPEETIQVDCSPEESRDYIIERIRESFPDAPAALEKLVKGL